MARCRAGFFVQLDLPLRGLEKKEIMQKLIWVMAGGALGATSRYLLAGLVQRDGPDSFPWGTMAVNVLGCFAFGLIWSLAEGHLRLNSGAQLMVLTGFLGAFTTFSTFIFETSALWRDANWGLAVANLLIQNLVGLISLLMGQAVANLFVPA